MGMEVAIFAAAAAELGKASMQVKAANARESQLEMQAQQLRLQHQQKTLANYDAMQKVLAAQEAAMTTRGVAFSSPSFNAIQRNVLNVGSKNQKNIDIENDLADYGIEIEKQNVKRTLFAQLFGDVEESVMGGLGIANNMPTSSGTRGSMSAPRKGDKRLPTPFSE
jgi:hypothetical protein